mmetsp:Transcript_42369/g.92307  ORF Transcript_42369/g.92307 Transcript_42369/m.92307 type:complete len:186 (+) Transcript_42369:2-559(+)
MGGMGGMGSMGMGGGYSGAPAPGNNNNTGTPVPGRLFCTRVAPDITKADLQTYFQNYGELEDVFVPSGGKGIAFVSFRDPVMAQQVLETQQHFVKPGKAVLVDQALDRPPLSGGGGGGRGAGGGGFPANGGCGGGGYGKGQGGYSGQGFGGGAWNAGGGGGASYGQGGQGWGMFRQQQGLRQGPY